MTVWEWDMRNKRKTDKRERDGQSPVSEQAVEPAGGWYEQIQQRMEVWREWGKEKEGFASTIGSHP
jgi:hypothetical protein